MTNKACSFLRKKLQIPQKYGSFFLCSPIRMFDTRMGVGDDVTVHKKCDFYYYTEAILAVKTLKTVVLHNTFAFACSSGR